MHQFIPQTLRVLVAATCLTLASAAQLPVDSLDHEITQLLTGQPGTGGRMIDMAYTWTGHLVVAYAEPDQAGDDRLIVGMREPNGSWNLLSSRSYDYEHILHLSIDVPDRGDGSDPVRDRVYVFAQLVTDIGESANAEDLWLISGPWAQPWGDDEVAIQIEYTTQPVPGRPWTDMSPGVACVPIGGSTSPDYSVELVFSYPYSSYYMDWNVLQARSLDYGQSYEDGRIVAGQCGNSDQEVELTNRYYRHPTIISDSRFGRYVIAFEDRIENVVRIVAGSPLDPAPRLIASTPGMSPGGVPRRERAPMLAADDGQYHITYISDVPGEGPLRKRLQLGYGSSVLGTLVNVGDFHFPVATPGDIEARDGKVFVAAKFYTDNVWPQAPSLFGIEATYTSPVGMFRSVANHWHYGDQPRAAITRNGELAFSIGYTVRDWDRYKPWLPDGVTAYVDL